MKVELSKGMFGNWTNGLAVPVIAAGLLSGCEKKSEPPKPGDFVTATVFALPDSKNDASAGLVPSGPTHGLLHTSPETVKLTKLNREWFVIGVQSVDGTNFYIDLFDAADQNSPEINVPGIQTLESFAAAMRVGAVIRFPTTFDGKSCFSASHLGAIDVDCVEIVQDGRTNKSSGQ